LQLDDYFRPEADVPVMNGYANWDDPEALFHQKMAADLKTLKAGQSIIVNTKRPQLNPDFLKTGKRIPIEFAPKPLIVAEGFLILHYPEIRRQLDLSVYLEAPLDHNLPRRAHGKLHNFPNDYDELVLKPMHHKFVKPSQQYAGQVLDVSNLSAEQVLDGVVGLLEYKGVGDVV
jgi:uridine kinase